MSAERTISLVQRKARTGRDVQAARAMSLGRALRLTAAKQADQMMALALAVVGVTRKTLKAQDVEAVLDADALILLMDGPGTQVAAAVLDPAFVTGLIQQQTMGRVSAPPPAEDARRHTATDAALCAPFIEALLTRAAPLPEEEADRNLLHGYRFGVWAQEPRQAQLALDAPAYELIEMSLDLAAGARTGKLTLIVPEPLQSTEAPEDESDGAPVQTRSAQLAQNVMGLHAELTVALTRLKLPLQQLSALKAGDLLDINLSSMAQALVIDANGRAISRGTLGQIDGVRAVQVEQQKRSHHNEPRRRAADRDELDLPDVTAPPGEAHNRRKEDATAEPAIPRLSDVDIFGDLGELPDLPDMEETAEEGGIWDQDDADAGGRQKQAGW